MLQIVRSCAATGRWPCVCIEEVGHRASHRCACGAEWQYQGSLCVLDEEVQTDLRMVMTVYTALIGAVEGPFDGRV